MYQYTIRVRREKYLWGSSGMKFNFEAPLYLVLRNDPFGVPITLFTETKDGPASRVPFGELNPGETYTFDLSNLHGVVAQCDLNSNVDCTVFHIPAGNGISQNPPSTGNGSGT